MLALSNTSKESTKYIHSTILKLQVRPPYCMMVYIVVGRSGCIMPAVCCFLQMLDHVTMVWDLRWNLCHNQMSESLLGTNKFNPISTVPTRMQVMIMSCLTQYYRSVSDACHSIFY